MKKVFMMVCMVMFLIGLTSICFAGAAEEAKAMVEKAIAYWKANGKEKAIAEFNNPNGQFVKGNMYIHVQDFNGILLANGGNPKLVGQNHYELKDPTGKYFVKEQVEVAKTKGSGWVTYMWTNPATKKLQQKQAYVQRVEGENLFIGCGFFK